MKIPDADSLKVKIRRVVTGHDDVGRAIVVSDGPCPNVRRPPKRPGFAMHEVWTTAGMPASLEFSHEPTDAVQTVEPPDSGTVIRICAYPPDSSFIDKVDRASAAEAFAQMGSGAAFVVDGTRHPLMHRTQTIDYAIVIKGQIVLVLDDSEVTLNPGDVVVQRATNHAWSNRTSDTTLVAFVLIDADSSAID